MTAMDMRGVKFGIVGGALSDDVRRAAEMARRVGFGGVQLEADGPPDVVSMTTSGRRELLRLLARYDQQLIGLRTTLGPNGFVPGGDVDRQLDRLDRLMEAAAALASPLLCVDLGALPPAPAPPAKPRPRIDPEQAGVIIIPGSSRASDSTEAPEPAAPSRPADPAAVAQLAGAMEELGRRADRYSVTVAFRSDLATLAALEHAVVQANCPWFGVDLDPVALLRDDWDLDETFSRLGGLIRHVRARDAVAGADRRTQPAPIGRGNTDFRAFLSALDAAGYHGWLTLDPLDLPHRAAAAAAGLEFLRNQ